MGQLDTSRKTLEITYSVKPDEGEEKTFSLLLDAQTLALLNPPPEEPPDWTRLEFSQCDGCPLSDTPHCPIALNLASVIEAFEDTKSFTTATVTVVTPQRTYTKHTAVQTALSGIIGIIMPTSGCPVMDPLRPNVRFHLPFANPLEASYRSIAMYLTAQAIRKMKGDDPDWDMKGLMEIYENIARVNKGMASRVKQATTTDSGANAIVILHAFGDSVAIMLESRLEQLEAYFSTLLTSGNGAAPDPEDTPPGT